LCFIATKLEEKKTDRNLCEETHPMKFRVGELFQQANVGKTLGALPIVILLGIFLALYGVN
jgi:hypothetical protein